MSRADQELSLGRIVTFGLYRNAPGMGRDMRTLDSFALVLALEGEAAYRDGNGMDRPIDPGDVILVFPGLPHHYGPRSPRGWSEFFIVFEGPVFDLWRERGILEPARPVYHLEPVDYWLQQFQSVVDRGPDSEFGFGVLDICRLQWVLARALEFDRAGAVSSRDRDWARRVCGLLEEDRKRKISMPLLAKKLGYSYEHFRKRFTRIVGMPPGRYRDIRMIHEASRLIQETDLTNKEIAYRLGFADECHFSHRFKQITGHAPRHFRKALPGAVRKNS